MAAAAWEETIDYKDARSRSAVILGRKPERPDLGYAQRQLQLS